MRHADRAAGRCDRDRRAGGGRAGAAVPHCPALGQRHCARLRRRQQPAGIFPATLGVPVIAVGVPTVVDAISLFRQAELELDVPRACWSRCRMWTHGCARWAGSSATAAIWRCTGDCRWVKFRLFCHKRSNYRYVNCIMSPPEQIAANRRVLITMWKCGKAIGVQKFFTLSTELSTPVFYELFLTNFGSQ